MADKDSAADAAFPIVPHTSVRSYGMSLRDYIAIHAMEGFIAHGYDNPTKVPVYAYEMADSMLAESKK